MGERPIVRLVAIVLLLGVVGWHLVDYAAHVDERHVYPTPSELDSAYTEHVGTEIDVWVTVAERRPGGFTTTGGWTVEATEMPANLDPGDSVQVFGVAHPDHHVVAERLVVTDRENRQYMFAVSVVGLLLAAGTALRHWRFEPGSLSFVPRDRAWRPGGDRSD